METRVQKERRRGYIYIVLASTCFGLGAYFVSNMTRAGAGSNFTVFTGHAFSLLPFLILILARQGIAGLKISKKALIYAILLGIFSKALFKLAYDQSVAIVGSAMGAVLLKISPVFVAIMARFIFGEKLSFQQVVALALNLFGAFLVVSKGDLSHLAVPALGVFLGVLAAFLFSLSTILGKFAVSTDDPITTSFYMMLFSSIFLLIATRPLESLHLLQDPVILINCLANVLLPCFIGNVFYLAGLAKPVEASKVGIFNSAEVVVATVLGVTLLGEPMNWVGILGIVILLGSIVLMNLELGQKKQEL